MVASGCKEGLRRESHGEEIKLLEELKVMMISEREAQWCTYVCNMCLSNLLDLYMMFNV